MFDIGKTRYRCQQIDNNKNRCEEFTWLDKSFCFWHLIALSWYITGEGFSIERMRERTGSPYDVFQDHKLTSKWYKGGIFSKTRPAIWLLSVALSLAFFYIVVTYRALPIIDQTFFHPRLFVAIPVAVVVSAIVAMFQGNSDVIWPKLYISCLVFIIFDFVAWIIFRIDAPLDVYIFVSYIIFILSLIIIQSGFALLPSKEFAGLIGGLGCMSFFISVFLCIILFGLKSGIKW